MTITEQDYVFIRDSLAEAKRSLAEGGLPIGSLMAESGEIVGGGHNLRVQTGDPTAHGEIVCIRNSGRRRRYDSVVLYTTLSPCMMCAGAIIQFGIPRVIVGESVNFPGNIEFLRDHGVEVELLQDQDCIDLMSQFIKSNPSLWDEDIAGRHDV